MATTNFKVFNEANAEANTYNDSEYLNATQRQNGVIPGMAISRMHNKMYRQWSVMCTAIANFLVGRGYDCLDTDMADIQAALESACGLNIRQDSTAYAVGDIAYSAALDSFLFVECTTAGTTASTIPAAFTGAAEGDSITDGTVVWIVRKVASMADIRAAVPGQRQPSTAYAVGDMASHLSLPYNWYLECTTAGTTTASALVITTPTVGGTVTDGSVTWTIREVANTSDIPDLSAYLTAPITPAFNKRDIVTTSGTYTAPVTGWYKITAKGGGGGGGGNYHSANAGFAGMGGGEGGTTITYVHMIANDTATVVIGGGGTGGAYQSIGADGGDTTVTFDGTTYTAGGGKGGAGSNLDANYHPGVGGSGTIHGCPGGASTQSVGSVNKCAGGAGGGAGGGVSQNGAQPLSATDGGGGAGAQGSPTSLNGGDGGDGYVWFEYFDTSLNP